MTMSETIRPGRHRVAALALDAVVPLDLGIPAQVFGAYPEAPYALTLCAERPGPVRTSAGFAVVAEAGLEALQGADTVIVPGFEPHDRPLAADVLAALRGSPARKVSIC